MSPAIRLLPGRRRCLTWYSCLGNNLVTKIAFVVKYQSAPPARRHHRQGSEQTSVRFGVA